MGKYREKRHARARIVYSSLPNFDIMDKLRHIVIIAELFPPDMGGGSTRASNVVKGLVKQGCYVTVVTAVPHYPYGKDTVGYTFRPLSVENGRGYRVVRVSVPPLPSMGIFNRLILFATFSLMSLLGYPYSSGAQVIWAANPNVISFFPASVYGFLRGCPVVQNVDDLWPEAPAQLGMMSSSLFVRIAGCIAGFVYRSASALTPISPEYVDVIIRNYSADPEKIYVIPSGVDTDVFKPGDSEKNGFFKVLYIGSFSVAYDFDCVLKAAELLREYDDVRFMLQGAGETLDRVRSSVTEMKLSNVDVINRIVSRKEVADALRSADVLLLPLGDSLSVQQGISSKLYEYQAVGKPIICCSNGMPGTYVSKTKSGLIVKPGDYEEMANSIIFLKDHMENSYKLGENGRRFVEDTLSIEKISLKVKHVLESIKDRKEK